MAVKISIRRTRRLRVLLARHYKLPEPPDPMETCLEQIVMTVLWQDAPPVRARLAYVNLAEEFVDWNELRVTMRRDITSILESCGLQGDKAACLKAILGRAIEELYCFAFEELVKRPREKLKAWFVGIEGLPHEVAAAVLYNVYGYDRVLVGPETARVVRRLGLVSQEATEPQIETAMAGVMPARDAHAIYNAFYQHARTVCTKEDFDCTACPLRKECDAGKQRIAEMEAAARAARKKAKAKAKAKTRPARAKTAKRASGRPAARAKASARKAKK